MRWGGVFAPNSPYRKRITLRPEVKKGFQFEDTEEGSKTTRKNPSWSKMLARIFKIDVTVCPCGGKWRLISAMQDRDEIRRYLIHEKIDHDPPARAPPRYRVETLDFA